MIVAVGCHQGGFRRKSRGVRELEQAGVQCPGPRVVGVEAAAESIKVFLNAHFSNAGRHAHRVGKIRGIEADARFGKFDRPVAH